MEYFVLALFGIIGIGMHILMKWRDAYTLKKEIDWKLHIINSSAASLVIIALLLLKSDLAELFPNELGLKAIFVMAGYQSDSVWKNFTKRTLNKMGIE